MEKPRRVVMNFANSNVQVVEAIKILYDKIDEIVDWINKRERRGV